MESCVEGIELVNSCTVNESTSQPTLHAYVEL